MAVNKATQDNLTAWKKKLLSKGGYTVPEYDDDEQLAKRNDYESVHRLMVNRGQVEEWGEREKRDVSSYAFSTKNAKGVKPFSASQRVEAPVFNAGNLPDSFIGPRMQDSSSISRTEKNSPTKESGLLDFWGNSKFGSAAISAKGGSGTGLDAFGKADVTAVTGKQQAMYPDLGAKSQEEQEQEAREAAFSLLMDSQKPKTDALGQPVEQDSFRITDTLAPVAENKPASSEILTGEPITPEQIAANKEQKENVPLRYRVGAAGRAAQNSVYNYVDNLVSTLEGLHTGTDRGIDVYGEQHAALRDSFNNIAQRVQRDLEEGYISPITAQIIDTGTRMLIDTAITLAGGAAFGRASAAMSSNSVANQVLKTIQSPIFYTSLAQEFGSSYQEYIDNGVDKAEARVVSAGISALNAFIEAQGGTEEMISGTVSKILNKAPFGKGTEAVQEFVTNAMEEALEEMIQAPVSNLGAKATYDPERQVFNAEEMLGNAGTAFVSSLLLGGVATGTHVLTSKAVNSVSRAADNASIGKQVKETDGALDTLAKAAGRSEDTDVQQNLRKVYTQVSEGAEPSAQAVGELVRAMQQDQTVSYQQVLEDISRSSGKAADPGTQQNTGSFVQEYSRTLGENGSKAFHTIAEKVSAEELPQLKNAFQAYYNYGQWGKDFGNVDTSFRSFIDEAGAYAAYSAGRNDAEATVARAQARLQSAENGTQAKAGSKPGLAANLASRAVSAAERSYLDHIGRAFNVSIEMYTADTATEGNGYTAGGKIYLNTNSTNKLAGVVNHELTHIMQERSPKAYQQYRDLVAAYVDRQERGWFDSQVERMIDGYAKRGQQITREEAVDEVVADASERFLSDEEAINTLVKENRSVARKVLDALREIIRKLSELVHGEGFDTRAAEVLSRDMEVYREAEKLWVKALSESSEARTVGNEARYQLVEDAEGNKVVLIQKNIFEGHEGESRIKVVRDYLRQHIGEVYTIIESGQKVYLGKDLPDEYTRSKYTQNINGNTRYAKNQAAQVMGEMIEISSNRRWEKTKHAQKHASDARYGFYKYTTRFAIKNGAEVYSADLVIRNANDGSKYLYDIINIKRNNSLPLAAAPQGSRQISPDTKNVGGVSPAVSYTNIISETGEEVKEFSEGKKFQFDLSKWQSEMTEEERTQYDAMQAEVDGLTPIYRKENDLLHELKESPAYIAYREDKKAKGLFVKAAPEDEEKYQIVRQIREQRGKVSELRQQIGELEEEQYQIQLAVQNRMREQEETRPKPVYSENTEQAQRRREAAVDKFGTTRSWNETGYILKGGQRLNFRGDGAKAGSRSMDHREVWDLFSDDGMSMSDALVAFVNEGNIRVMPELPGITVAMGTTISEEQEQALRKLITAKGNSYFSADMINEKGDTLDTLEYERSGNPDRIIRDIKSYLETGKKPERSMIADFHTRYQFSQDDSGQTQTAAFKNWFGDWQDDPENASKVVNQDGTPKIMFRGDNNDIEVFDRKKSKSGNLYGRGFYFTESENHANTYGAAKAYYLNIRNPLSTGHRTLTKAQIHSFLQSIADGDDEDYDLYNYGEYATVESILKSVWGNGKRSDFQMLQDINASAIGDMVYTVEWFNRVNDTDFDGFILPTETVVFDSRQIKSATDNNGEFSPVNPNVHYQFSEDEFDWLDDGGMDEDSAGYEWLDEQIDGAISGDDDGTITAQLAAVRAETKALEGNRLDEQQVNRVVKEVLRSYSSKYSAEKMADVVNDALSAIRSRGNAGFAESVAAVYARAKTAVEASERLDRSLWDAEDVRSIRQTIRGTRMYVSEKERGDFKDGYNNYRRETFGTFKLTSDPADMSVDQVYTELSRDYPGYFDGEAVSAHEQLEAMRDFLTAVRPTYTNEFEGNVEETALDMTAELLHQASVAAQERNVSEAVRADRSRQAKKYAENKKKLREKYTAKYKAGIQAEREKGARRAASAKEQYQRKLTQQKEKYEARSERQKAGYEKREAEWKEQKQRFRDQCAGYRERIKTIREQNKQSRKAATDRRITTQIRHKIEKVVINLGKELEHPTDTKHVPVELRGTVAAFLNTLDLSAQQEGLAASPFKETQRQAAWRKLRDTCEKIINEETGDSESWYIVVDPDIVSRIDDLLSSGAVYHLNELNREQAEELYKLVRAVDHMVRYTDKVRLEGQMVSATETARGIIEENQNRMKETRRILGALNKAEGFFKYDLLDPTRFSDMFGEHFHDLFHNLRAAENQKISRWAEVEEYFGKLAADNGFKKSDLRKLEEDYKEFTVGNSRIRLSTAQVMSLYLTNKREQGRSHLYAGGISLPDERKGTKVRENRRSYRITEAEVEAIIGTLSDAQRKLADGMQAFASGQMSNWGNEASMYLYGYKKFTEKNYWPISSDPNYTRSEVSLQQTAAKNASLKNQGMTKALVEKASNPIQIDSAFDVFARHGTQMAAYSAYVGPLEDLNKVINWQTRHDGNWRSVRETLSGVGGAGALRYLNRFIDDVNGQAAGESSPYEGLMGAAKAASIAGNMRVVVQQPTAYWRAMAVIPPRHLLSGIAGHRVDTEEMHSVAPVTRWKEWGYFRDGASGSNLKELMVGKKGVKDRFVDKTMALAGKADDMTWKQLYRAVENWVSADGLERGTEEYRQEVGKRFTDVIDRTQVVDSVFQRTQAMRNNGFGWKMATAFMAEPLKSYNLLVGSFRQIGIAGDKKAAVKGAVMATVGFITSTLINAVVQSAWDVGRDKDPEETRADKFFQALLGDGVYAAIKDGESLGGNAYEVSLALLGGNLQDGLNPLNLIPVVKDVLSFYEGNDVQVMGLSAIADLMTAANNLAGAARGDSKKYTTEYYAVQLVRKLSAATGLPVGNIYREVESLINFTVTTFEEKTGVNASKLRFELDKLYLSPNGSRSVYYNLMYAARRDGNNELAAEVGNFLMASGVSRQTIENAMLSRIEKDAALSEVIVGYAEAYQAMDSEKMQALIDEAGKSGISGDELHRAAMRLIPSDEEEEAEAEEAFTADNLGDEAEMTDSYQVEALTNSLLSGDRANANAFNQSLLDAGKEQKEIDSRVQTQLKKRMLEAMGYESEKEMQEAGAKFDTQTEEYQYLHDHYGYTQYGYDDLVTAYLSGNGYDAIYRDMLGQHSSGDNVYTAEGMEKELKSRIQQEFNAVYFGGTGSGWEQYRDALKKLGKSWDEILYSYKRSNAGKEWLRK